MNKNSEKVRLVADPYPPYQYEEDGAVKGVDHDIITAVFQEYSIETITQLFPWEVCIEHMEMKKADGIFQITSTPEREKTFLFSKPFRTARTVFFSTARASVSFHKDGDILSQLKGYRLGVVAGYSYDPLIDRLKEPLKIAVKSQEMLLEGLVRGTFNLAIMDLGVAEYLIKKMGVEDIKRVGGFEITRQLHVAFQQDRNKLVTFFNTGLDKVQEKGLYEGIFETYGLDS